MFPTRGVRDLEALRRGDAAAFTRLHGDQRRSLEAVARRYLSNEADVQDAVQEAFLCAFRAIERFDGRAAVESWLHAICANAARMRLRSMQRQPHTRSLDGGPPGGDLDRALPDGDAPDPRERSEVGEERALILALMPDLPPRYAEVINLRDLAGLDTRTTAARLGTTGNTVKVRLHRARKALRALLEERGVVA